MVHVGLIGAGNISDTHARAAAAVPGVTIAAVYGPTRARAEQLASKFGACVFDSLEAMLTHRPLDMVAIGTPSGRHAEEGIAAAKQRLHVLVEKPIDVTAARADELIAETDRAGVRLAVIFQDRLKPDIRRVKEIIASGGLGQPILATAHVKWYRAPEYYAESRWRGTRALDGGGALMNQGIHTVDLLLWLFGPVKRVFGRAATELHRIEVEDTAVALLEFENGALGTIEATTAAYPGYSRRVELTGSEGTLVLDGDTLTAIDLRNASQAQRASAGQASISASSPVVADASAHQRVFEDFVRAVVTGARPACDGREGRQSVAVIEAIYESARTGRMVEPK